MVLATKFQGLKLAQEGDELGVLHVRVANVTPGREIAQAYRQTVASPVETSSAGLLAGVVPVLQRVPAHIPAAPGRVALETQPVLTAGASTLCACNERVAAALFVRQFFGCHLNMWNDVRAKLLWDNLPSTIFLTVIKQPVVRHLDVRLVTDCSNSLVRSENVKLKYADQLVDRRLHDCIGVGALHYRSFDSVVFTQIQLSWRGARLFRGAC